MRLRERWDDLMQRLNVDKVWRPLFAFQMVLSPNIVRST